MQYLYGRVFIKPNFLDGNLILTWVDGYMTKDITGYSFIFRIFNLATTVFIIGIGGSTYSLKTIFGFLPSLLLHTFCYNSCRCGHMIFSIPIIVTFSQNGPDLIYE